MPEMRHFGSVANFWRGNPGASLRRTIMAYRMQSASPSEGVPAYDIMSPTGGPFRTIDRHIFVLDFRGLPRIHKFTHTGDVDPDLVAPKAP